MSFTYPSRIEPDAVLEALVEFRFESSDLPEVVVGRLIDSSWWADYQQTRLPVADIPQTFRDSDPNLRYQATLELRRQDGLRAVKIGGRVVSFHVTTHYPGWAIFGAEVKSYLAGVQEKIRAMSFNKISLRYINAFNSIAHSVSSLDDTNFHFALGNEKINKSINVNYVKSEDRFKVTSRITTADLVLGALPPDAAVLFDIEISTNEKYAADDKESAWAWIEEAHAREKLEFFSILPQSKIRKLQNNAERGAA